MEYLTRSHTYSRPTIQSTVPPVPATGRAAYHSGSAAILGLRQYQPVAAFSGMSVVQTLRVYPLLLSFFYRLLVVGVATVSQSQTIFRLPEVFCLSEHIFRFLYFPYFLPPLPALSGELTTSHTINTIKLLTF